jgi:hypothetical protein
VNDKVNFTLSFTAPDLRRESGRFPLQIRAHPAGGFIVNDKLHLSLTISLPPVISCRRSRSSAIRLLHIRAGISLYLHAFLYTVSVLPPACRYVILQHSIGEFSPSDRPYVCAHKTPSVVSAFIKPDCLSSEK